MRPNLPNLPNLTNPRLARRLAPALVATLALAAASAGAAMTKTFRQTSAKDFEEGEATASLILPDGAVVPGMKPSPIAGLLLTVDPESGAMRLLATLGVDPVWALVVAANTGIVYAGTGGPGKIFAIDPSGKSREVWASGDQHVVSLLQADAGHLYAGTSDQAILFRVGLDGKAAVSYTHLTLPTIYSV